MPRRLRWSPPGGYRGESPVLPVAAPAVAVDGGTPVVTAARAGQAASVQRSAADGPASASGPAVPVVRPALSEGAPASATAPAGRARRGERPAPSAPAVGGDAVAVSAGPGGRASNVPLVRLAPPGPSAAPAVQRLPVAGPPASVPASPTMPPPSGGSWTSGGAPGGLGAPGAGGEPPVRTVSWVAQPQGGAGTPPRPAASPGPSAETARVLQRVAEQAGLSGVPLTAVPARSQPAVQTRAAPPRSPSRPGPALAGGPRIAGRDRPRRTGPTPDRTRRTAAARRTAQRKERAGRPYDGRR